MRGVQEGGGSGDVQAVRQCEGAWTAAAAALALVAWSAERIPLRRPQLGEHSCTIKFEGEKTRSVPPPSLYGEGGNAMLPTRACGICMDQE